MDSASGLYQPIKREQLLSRCDFFLETQLWPLKSYLDPSRWLDNFQPHEHEYALYLLNGFLYYEKHIVNRLFVRAFQSLSQYVCQFSSYLRARAEWRRFLGQVLVLHVTGERPNSSDSGHLFVRMARDDLKIDEKRIVTAGDALSQLLRNPEQPIVFVDDFVGSGNQFCEMWHRSYQVPERNISMSFNDLSKVLPQGGNLYYCCVICTERGRRSIRQHCPNVSVSPSHFVGDRYSVISSESMVWPEHLKSGAYDFIRETSYRAGIPDLNGAVGDWRGFNKLGLAIGFSHGVPDATIPLFTWNRNGWQPLVRSE